MASRLAGPALAGLLVLLALTPGCLGTSTVDRCVESVQAGPAGQATIRADGATFTYSDPSGLVSANWNGRGVYSISVENAIITQTLKGFSHLRGCPLLS